METLLRSIFILALVLRALLAAVNLDANDDHHKAVQLMLETRSLTSYIDCGQCYHPKLFHGTAAAVQVVLGLDDRNAQLRSGQFINVLMGILLLAALLKVIRMQPWDPLVQAAVFGLIALNPKLIAINAQYTNDTFALAFAAFAILGTVKMLAHGPGRWNAFLIIAGCTGAALSKGSGLPLTFALLIFLAVYWVLKRERMVLATMAVTVLLFMSVVPLAGNYVQNYRDSGQVLNLNGELSPPPHFLKKTYVDRPGVISVVHSYLTFYPADLLRNPYIVNDYEGYARNRTSVWSQLYGRTFSTRFDQWPLSWMSIAPSVKRTTRLLLILGVVPSVIFLAGLTCSIMLFLGGLRSGDRGTEWLLQLLMLLVFAAMITMLLKLTFQHRDFCTMKAIYIWPGLASIAYFIGIGMQRIARMDRRLLYTAGIAIMVLLGTWVYEILHLVDFLT